MTRVRPRALPAPTGQFGGPQAMQQMQQIADNLGVDLDQLLGNSSTGSLDDQRIGAALQQMARQSSMQQGLAFGGGNGGFDQGLASGLAAQGAGFNPLAGNVFGGGNQGGQVTGLAAGPRFQGFAGGGSMADLQLQALAEAGGGGGYFEDRVFAIMCKVVEDMQRKIEQRLQKLQQDAQAAEATQASGGKDTGGESRNIEFEKIKFDMQKLSQMQQAMSNVLNSMDELAKSAIRHIKAG